MAVRKSKVEAAASPLTAPAKPPTRKKAAPATPKPGLVLVTASVPAALAGPSDEDLIRLRAYELYERDGAVDGCAIVHWLAAEAEIKGRDRTGVLGPG